MTHYTIAAFPTEYKGRTYRSRLEARWAAFFDHLGLKHEYEPFDLGIWSPDFLLPELETLVEIKPLTEFDADVWAKIVAACNERGLLSGEKAVGGLLMTRVAPQLHHHTVDLGWCALPWREGGMVPKRALVGWVPDEERPVLWPAIAMTVDHPFGWTTTTGGGRGFSEGYKPTRDDLDRLAWPESYGDYTMKLWARATSDVQWRPDEEA